MSTSFDITDVIREVIGNSNFTMLVFFALVVLLAFVFAILRGFVIPQVFFGVIELLILAGIGFMIRDAIVKARV